MKFETFTVTRKDGSIKSAEVAIPENVKDCLKIYPEGRIVRLVEIEYRTKMRKKLLSGRSRRVVIKMDTLSLEHQKILREIGILPAS